MGKTNIFFLFAVAAVVVAMRCAQSPNIGHTPNIKWYTDNVDADTFYIAAADELAGLAALVNNEAGLEKSIDFSYRTITLTQNINLSQYGSNFNGGKGWIPIGKGDTIGRVFRGVFNGNGKTISGLYVNDDDTAGSVGLFGTLMDVSEGTIPVMGMDDDGNLAEVEEMDDHEGYGFYKGETKVVDLGLADVNVTGQKFVGGIAGDVIGSQILNCYVTGKVNGVRNVGGIAGYMVGNNCIVSKGYTNVAVSGDKNVGGVVGYVDGRSEVSNSYSLGAVNGDTYVGGVAGQVGYLSGGISNCYSSGSINGNIRVGGVAGTIDYGGGISNSYSTGTVSGNDDVGGVAGGGSNCGMMGGGVCSMGDVAKSYSTGIVSGKNNVGGVVGSGCVVFNCYSTGKVTGESNVGGVVGNGGEIVANSYSTGAISGKNNVGGIVGNAQGSVARCYSTSTVTGEENVGGIAGAAQFARAQPTGSTSLTSGYDVGTNEIVDCAALNHSLKGGGWSEGQLGRIAGSIERNVLFRYDNNYSHGGQIIKHAEDVTLRFKLSHNAAFVGLKKCVSYRDTCSDNRWPNKNFENLNGADITTAGIKFDGTLGGRFTSENGWTTQNGKLPGLLGQTVELPEHLR